MHSSSRFNFFGADHVCWNIPDVTYFIFFDRFRKTSFHASFLKVKICITGWELKYLWPDNSRGSCKFHPFLTPILRSLSFFWRFLYFSLACLLSRAFLFTHDRLDFKKNNFMYVSIIRIHRQILSSINLKISRDTSTKIAKRSTKLCWSNWEQCYRWELFWVNEANYYLVLKKGRSCLVRFTKWFKYQLCWNRWTWSFLSKMKKLSECVYVQE